MKEIKEAERGKEKEGEGWLIGQVRDKDEKEGERERGLIEQENEHVNCTHGQECETHANEMKRDLVGFMAETLLNPF